MRDFLDSVLAFIDLESLTDPEWELIESDLEDVDADYNAETYAALDTVLKDREETYATRQRLKDVYSAKGIDVDKPAEPAPNSNIFLGGPLE